MFYYQHFICGDCHEQQMLMDVGFTAKGDIKYSLYCPKCEVHADYNTTMQEVLIHANTAINQDLATLPIKTLQ